MADMAKVPAAQQIEITDPISKGQAIIEAAARVFLDRGYGAASMDAIAVEAGVSKQTVYSHFGAKDALFGAIVEGKCNELLASVSLPPVTGQDHGEALRQIATRFLDTVLASPSMALFRVVVAESSRFPELADVFYRAGPAVAIDNLAAYLEELDEKGALKIADATSSARLFYAMLRGDLYLRRLLGLASEPAAGEIDAVVDEVISAFLKAHAPA
jgi:TetR/AcrR family transcriptional repressor of mexJK operon